MNRHEFLLNLDELLELDPGSLSGDEALADLDAWDSLAVISFIALVDEQLGVVVEGQRLADAKSVADLVALVQDRLTAE